MTTVPIVKPKSQTTETASSAVGFESLFQAHWPRVYGVIFRLVGDHDEAEDLALEAFLKLHAQLNRPRGMALTSASGWLYRVASNLGLNAIRSRKRRERYELEAGKRSLAAAPYENPAVAVEKAEERQRVRRVLAKMKPQSAKILVLRHSGLSYAEVAAALKVSPNSVGKLLSRAEADFEVRWKEVEDGREEK